MVAASPVQVERVEGREQVSFTRLLWVGPLAVVTSVLACMAVRWIVLTLDPNLASMGQLRTPMTTLAIEGAVAAVIVFAIFGLIVPRPIFWFRIVGVAALVLSFLPDIGLLLGGAPMIAALRVVGPLATLGFTGPRGGGPPPGGPRPGADGPPGGFLSGAPLEQVLVLMLLHATVATVCIVMLTTLARKRD
jgi:hypothetical protein